MTAPLRRRAGTRAAVRRALGAPAVRRDDGTARAGRVFQGTLPPDSEVARWTAIAAPGDPYAYYEHSLSRCVALILS